MEVYGSDINGIEGKLISFKAIKEEGRRGVTLLGLAQKVVIEGYHRAAKAIETLDGSWSDVLSNQGYTIQLSPAETPKVSSGLDLPIAIMLLTASVMQSLDSLEMKKQKLEKQLKEAGDNKNKEALRKKIIQAIATLVEQRKNATKYRTRLSKNPNKYLLIGTLDIVSGQIKTPEYGMLGMISAAKPGFVVIIPEESEIHGAIVAKAKKRIGVLKAKNLQEVWDIVLGLGTPRKVEYKIKNIKRKSQIGYFPDLNAINGVHLGKKAMIVALAGGHNILLVGPPGQGKSMLAKASINLLPNLSSEEMFEVNKVYSAKGELNGDEVVLDRPFQEGESNTTPGALFGGGMHPPLPGLISLAHKGILLLDEINLFPATLIERLRNPLNNRIHKVQNLYYNLEYPCNFILVAAMNPCKCGWFNHFICPTCDQIFIYRNKNCPNDDTKLVNKCSCKSGEISRYKNKLSKPLLDRIDLKVLVSKHDEGIEGGYRYASSTIKKELAAARDIQNRRYRDSVFGNLNASVPDESQYDKYCLKLLPNVKKYYHDVCKRYSSSKRMDVKLLLVSRTLGDLEGVRNVRIKDVDDAIQIMGMNNPYFYDLY